MTQEGTWGEKAALLTEVGPEPSNEADELRSPRLSADSGETRWRLLTSANRVQEMTDQALSGRVE